mmetsp:Transcript_37259/g.85988  ORF Transcript_37259/g.85988 Transcript_37259/m.85988 type:complete len:286 (+) Transcript_37259:208-1065(+)
MTVFFSCYFGGFCAFIADCQRCGWHFVLGAAAEGMGHLVWNFSVVQTSSANSCIFYAMSPIWCALFTIVWTRRLPPLYTMAAVVAVIVIALTTYIQSRSSARDTIVESAIGDIFGIGTGFFHGLFCAITADAAQKYPDGNMLAVGCLGAFLPLACSLWMEGAQVLRCWPNSGVLGFAWPLLNATLMSSTAALNSLSLKYCEPVLFTLISLLDTLTEPGLVWLVLGEAPLNSTLTCGLLLCATLAAHEIVANYSMELDNGKAKQEEALESSASESTPLLQETKQQV